MKACIEQCPAYAECVQKISKEIDARTFEDVAEAALFSVVIDRANEFAIPDDKKFMELQAQILLYEHSHETLRQHEYELYISALALKTFSCSGPRRTGIFHRSVVCREPQLFDDIPEQTRQP